jgi:hypothetical protein
LRPGQAKKLVRLYLEKQASTVIHYCNPSYRGSKDRRVMVQGQPWAKKRRTYPKNKLKQKGMEVWLKW